MSFSVKEQEFLEFDKNVRDMEITVESLEQAVVAEIHNELIRNCDDYRTIGGFSEIEDIVKNDVAGIVCCLPDEICTVEGVIGELIDAKSRASAILRASVYFGSAPFLIQAPSPVEMKMPVIMYKGLFVPGEEWNHIIHSLAILFAIRGKTPQEMFAGKFFPAKEEA